MFLKFMALFLRRKKRKIEGLWEEHILRQCKKLLAGKVLQKFGKGAMGHGYLPSFYSTYLFSSEVVLLLLTQKHRHFYGCWGACMGVTIHVRTHLCAERHFVPQSLVQKSYS